MHSIMINFFRAADLSDPKERMVEVVRWYLSSISASKKVMLIWIYSLKRRQCFLPIVIMAFTNFQPVQAY